MPEDKPNFLVRHGIVPWHIIMFSIMLLGTITQFVVFRTQTEDFEAATSKELAQVWVRITQLETGTNSVHLNIGIITTRLDHIEHQIERLVQQNDRIIEQLN